MTENASSKSALTPQDEKLTQAKKLLGEDKVNELMRKADKASFNGGRNLQAIWKVRHPKIKDTHKAIMMYFAGYCDVGTLAFDDQIKMTTKEIAEDLGCSPRSLIKNINLLVELGYMNKWHNVDIHKCHDACTYALTTKVTDEYRQVKFFNMIERELKNYTPPKLILAVNNADDAVEKNDPVKIGPEKIAGPSCKNFRSFIPSSFPEKTKTKTENAKAVPSAPATASASNRNQNPKPKSRNGGAPVTKLTYSDYINSHGEPETWEESEKREAEKKASRPESKTLPVDVKNRVQEIIKGVGACGTQAEYKMLLHRLYGLYNNDDNLYLFLLTKLMERWPRNGESKMPYSYVLQNQWDGFVRNYNDNYAQIKNGSAN